MASTPILSFHDLSVSIDSARTRRTVLDGFSLDVPKGQSVALMGESGSGKTLAALSVLGLLPHAAAVQSGEIVFDGEDLLHLDERRMAKIRGDRIGMVFQEPVSCLNPLMHVGEQIGESLQVHKGLGARITRQQVLALMELVGIPDPPRRYNAYPHQLSSGVRQRVLIAAALACKPDLLLADDPTSSLDLTVQAQILDLLARLKRDLRMSVLLISHDIGVVATLADRVAVLFAGRIVEEGTVGAILRSPAHPFTRALLNHATRGGGASRSNRVASLSDSAPDAPETSSGCPLAPTCDRADDLCRDEVLAVTEIAQDHRVLCRRPVTQ